jgi:hypothetical protein
MFIVIAVLSLSPSIAEMQTESSAMPDARLEEATELMMRFAERTGLNSERPPRRWGDEN